MARKSRRNNNIIEKKQEMMTPEIITGRSWRQVSMPDFL